MYFYRTLVLLCSTTILVTALSESLYAQPLVASALNNDENLLRQPSAPKAVAPLTARFVLNGETLDYSSKGSLTFGLSSGTGTNMTPIFTGTFALSTKLTEGIVDGVFERHQSGWYLQHQRIERKREVKVTQHQAVDMIGFKLKFSATGDCQFSDALSGQLCTYTPGLATVPGSYEPKFFLPTKFAETSQAGDVISQETFDALTKDGWQRGVDGGDEVVGVDFDIPNSGTVESTARANLNGIERDEKVSMRSVLSLSKVEQGLYSNDTEASIARTTRGFVLLEKDEWTRKATLMQIAAWILPKVDAKLQQGDGDPNLGIANNLFYAANNQWTPRDSFAIFQTGRGYVDHSKQAPRDITETPASYFNGVWMGFTPVRSTQISTSSWLIGTGPRETTHGPYFSQGGLDNVFNSLNSSITIVDDIIGEISQIELSNINNLYVQSGLELTTQNALAYASTRETSRYSLVPHIAFSGNRTDGTSVFRYYLGAILNDQVNAYVGADYSKATQSNILFTARAEAYNRPDRDYYSFAEVRAIKSTQLSNGDKISYGVGARKAFDRPVMAVDKFDSLSKDSVFDLFAKYEAQNGAAYDFRHRISNDDKIKGSSTTLGIGFQVSDNISINAQVTPTSTEGSYIRARAGLSWRASGAENAGTFQLQVADTKYNYGIDSAGQRLSTSERSLLAAYQVKF